MDRNHAPLSFCFRLFLCGKHSILATQHAIRFVPNHVCKLESVAGCAVVSLAHRRHLPIQFKTPIRGVKSALPIPREEPCRAQITPLLFWVWVSLTFASSFLTHLRDHTVARRAVSSAADRARGTLSSPNYPITFLGVGLADICQFISAHRTLPRRITQK